MKSDKLDYKKEYKDLYQPGMQPALTEVPPMTFLMADGRGAPGGEAYQAAMQALYSITFTIKMSKMSGNQPAGYFEYVVPPLEGLWWSKDGTLDWAGPKESWYWTSMLRQPEFVTQAVFDWAVTECRRKKPELSVETVRLERFREGLCVQAMHLGPYDQETKTIGKIEAYMEENALENLTGNVYKHHEIYLSDPRRTAAEKLKTVLRLPVAKKEEA